MTDKISSEQRSRNMSRIRSRDTKPEIIVRSVLHRAGFRFRLHVKELPGKPDIVLPKHRAVIFVHGCFWHQHGGCGRSTMPSSRAEYWRPKLEANVARDKLHRTKLSKLGWKVGVVWECETRELPAMIERLERILRPQSTPQ